MLPAGTSRLRSRTATCAPNAFVTLSTTMAAMFSSLLWRLLPRQGFPARVPRLSPGSTPGFNAALLADVYYPKSAWLCLRKDVFDQLARYKSRRGLPSWEPALERLLVAKGTPAGGA